MAVTGAAHIRVRALDGSGGAGAFDAFRVVKRLIIPVVQVPKLQTGPDAVLPAIVFDTTLQ